MAMEQSARPEDTRLAREEGLTASDFVDETGGLADIGRDDIRAVTDRVIERVPCPEWGGALYIRSLTGAERDAFEDASIQGRGKNRRLMLRNIRARLLVMCVCGSDGKRMFSDADAEWLGGKNASVLDRLFTVAQRLSGLSEQDVEELVGNSEPGPSA